MAKIESVQLVNDINKEISKQLADIGYTSSQIPSSYEFDGKALSSNWSHRHIAYIAGLGTFGIHNLLITKKGCCGEIGTIVTNMPLKPSEKIENEYCIYKVNRSCTRCVTRCVAKAMSTKYGYPYVDRQKCHDQIYDEFIPKYDNGIGDTCGKCMCGVPCSTRNPIG